MKTHHPCTPSRGCVQAGRFHIQLSSFQTNDIALSGVRCWCQEQGRRKAEGEEMERKRAGARWEFGWVNWVGTKS